MKPRRLMGLTHVAAAALALLALTALEGCSAIGFGIGSAVPKYEPVALDSAPSVPAGTDVEINTKTAPRTIPGKVDGVEGGDFVIRSPWSPSGETRIPIEQIRELRVQKGDCSLMGLAAGAVIDALVVTIVVVLVATSHSSPTPPPTVAFPPP